MNWDKLTKMLQLAGAMLAVPAGIAGVYSVYRSHFSSDIACQALRTAIVTTMEKNIAAEAKRSLLRKDVAEFEKTCGAIDPDAKAIFTATLHQLEAPPPPPATTTAAPPAGSPTPQQHRPFAVAAQLLAGPPADRGGWVALGRRDAPAAELNFEGYAISARALPPAGTVLTARWPVPIWSEPQPGSRPDLGAARGLIRAGMCVQILAGRLGEDRLWAQVVPAACS